MASPAQMTTVKSAFSAATASATAAATSPAPDAKESAAGAAVATTLNLSVMTFNVLAEVWVKPEWFVGIEASKLLHAQRYPRSTEMIIKSRCDVVFIQEATELYRDSLLETKIAQLYNISALSTNHPTDASAANGTLVLTRKGLACEPFRIRVKGNGFVGVSFTESSVQLLGVHLDWADDGTAQLTEVIKLIGNGSAAVFGDWNKVPAEIEALEIMKTSGGKLVKDSTPSCYNPKKGGMHLDHCATFGKEPVSVVAKRYDDGAVLRLKAATIADPVKALEFALDTAGSDHFPVAFDVKLPRSSAAIAADNTPLVVYTRQRPWTVDAKTGALEKNFVAVSIAYLITEQLLRDGKAALDACCTYESLSVPQSKSTTVEDYHLTMGHGFTDQKTLDVANAMIAAAKLTRADIAIDADKAVLVVGQPVEKKYLIPVAKLKVSQRVLDLFDAIYKAFPGMLSNKKLAPHTSLMYANNPIMKAGVAMPPASIPATF